jgi:putative nucleotidyltransferase with HDIG domain
MWKLSENKEWRLLEEEFSWVRDMTGVPQDKVHHREGDVAIHTAMVLSALEQLEEYIALSQQDRQILWAGALLHDVEKRSTTVVEPDGSITSKGHAKKGALTTRSILYRDVPTPFNIREQISALVRFHGLPIWALEKHDPARAVIEASLQVNTRLLAILARADILGRTCFDKNDLLYRIDLFEALCEENDCWGKPRAFVTDSARYHYFHAENSFPGYVPFDEFGSRVVMMSGLPGAGKDTYVQKHFKDWPEINLDNIRKANKILPTDKSGNGRAIQLAKEKARTYLRAGKNFVWNATNITRQMRDQLGDLFYTYKAFITIVYVEVDYQKLFVQNRSRQAVLPAPAVERMVAKLEVPVQSEAHEVVYYCKDKDIAKG